LATTELSRTESLAATVSDKHWPRIALVTPARNCAPYMEATIRSVLAQEYPNLDYFIVDGGSTDGTVDIIRKYEDRISGWISEPDNGMYDALNKGFARTTGEIMGWISATDTLHPGGLRVVGSVFRDLPEVEWITGRATACTEAGMTTAILDTPHWSRWRFLMGANRAIQQESTFWRRSLWERAGGCVDASRRMSSDFELWVRFFRYAKLYPVSGLIGNYRSHPDALGLQQQELCYRIQDQIIEAELRSSRGNRLTKLLRGITRALKPVSRVHWLWEHAILLPLQWILYRAPGPDWPPVITYAFNPPSWRFSSVPRRVLGVLQEIWQDIIVKTFWIRRRLGLRRQNLQKLLDSSKL
jgi:glycosyltransferase involved in cell wall biosynthesis